VATQDGEAAPGCRVVLRYRSGTARADLLLPDAWRVRPDPRLAADLRGQRAVAAVGYVYGADDSARGGLQ